MIKTKKTNINFLLILISIIIFFSFLLYLSIPAFFDYRNIESKLENKIYKEFKINTNIIGNISYKVLPLPHLLIEKANLSLDNFTDKSKVVQVKNLKLLMSINKLYSKSEIRLDKLEITNANFKYSLKDLKDFRKHFLYKINKPIKISKSKIFILDKDKNTILISPVKNLIYFINSKSRLKHLKIKGNLFDINYNSSWKKYYDKPNETLNQIKFTNPNISIKNKFNLNSNSNFEGNSAIKFLNENILINYSIKDNEILVTSPNENKNLEILVNSKIDLKPFDFKTQLTFLNKDVNFFIDDFLYNILNLDKELLGNLNGKLTLNFKDLKNELIDNGVIELTIREKVIKMYDSIFEIKDIGKINTKISYYEDKGDLVFISKNILEIEDPVKFSKKFNLNINKVDKVKKILFEVKKNIQSKNVEIYNIHINNINLEKKSESRHAIKNIQNLRSLLKKLLN